jgi:hypothetical protein
VNRAVQLYAAFRARMNRRGGKVARRLCRRIFHSSLHSHLADAKTLRKTGDLRIKRPSLEHYPHALYNVLVPKHDFWNNFQQKLFLEWNMLAYSGIQKRKL